ncbi:DegT/DnrJ/EryC1/StrS family aminotransferase [Pikeienuella sp. HZG-20]|uniref:DegT/DnrJ/EryC1/StrS family aminotransferase n=1 Tax=Paludibacillus litoralis TaxID=3133267 RepID=UPI0030EDA183
MIPFIDLKTQYSRLKDDIDARIHAVLDGGQYVMGPAVTAFEEELCAYTGARNAISCSSGTDALFMPLLAMGVGAGDAVFVPSFTYTSTAEAILLAGAAPVFVDVDPGTFLIDMDDLRAKIAQTRAAGRLTPRVIMPVDLFGQPADYAALNALAREEDLKIVADAAQAFGARKGGTMVGAMTDITSTSFYPSKPLGCYGDGGAIFTDDDALADVLRSVRSHGKGAHKYDVVRVGVNGRLDSIQAAVLSSKLSIFEDELASRERVARRYDAALAEVVRVPARVSDSRSVWAQYTIRTTERERLQAGCKERGVPTMVFYPVPMHLQPAYSAYGDGEGSLPASEQAAREVVSLPMNPYLSETQVDAVCDSIRDALSVAQLAE